MKTIAVIFGISFIIIVLVMNISTYSQYSKYFKKREVKLEKDDTDYISLPEKPRDDYVNISCKLFSSLQYTLLPIGVGVLLIIFSVII